MQDVLEAIIYEKERALQKVIGDMRHKFFNENEELIVSAVHLSDRFSDYEAQLVQAFRSKFLADRDTPKTQRGLALTERRMVTYDDDQMDAIMEHLEKDGPEFLTTSINKRDFHKAVLSKGNPYKVPGVTIETKTEVRFSIKGLKGYLRDLEEPLALIPPPALG